MLSNPELFRTVEEGLASAGAIKAFEEENGPITGRVMINRTRIPDNVNVVRLDWENLAAFEASFDFCDVALGVVVDPKQKTQESSAWLRYQVRGARRPSDEWVQFLIRTLFEHIEDDGSYDIPIFAFVNDQADFTVAPEASPVPDAASDEEPDGELTEEEGLSGL